MSTPDRQEHALKLKDEVTWLIDGLKAFAAASPDEPVGVRAFAWSEGLFYLVADLDRVIGTEHNALEESNWGHDEVVALVAKLLTDEGRGSKEGAEHMARELIRVFRQDGE